MRIAAVILAAGQSRRFGPDNKLLARLNGQPLLQWTLSAVLAADFDGVAAVTGDEGDRIAPLVAGTRVRLVPCLSENPGIGASIAAGVAAMMGEADGILILPGDMPLITPQGLQRLATAFVSQGGTRIVYAATHEGLQRNPVIWPRETFAALSGLSGDMGGKSLLQAAGSSAIGVPVLDECELLDVDDAETLELARHVLSRRPQRVEAS